MKFHKSQLKKVIFFIILSGILFACTHLLMFILNCPPMVYQLRKTNSKKDHNARLCTFDIAWNRTDRLGRFKEVKDLYKLHVY